MKCQKVILACKVPLQDCEAKWAAKDKSTLQCHAVINSLPNGPTKKQRKIYVDDNIRTPKTQKYLKMPKTAKTPKKPKTPK